MPVFDVLSNFNSSDRLIETVEEFNSVCEHVVLLLEEAACIFERGGYSTATFLAITAIEETAKAHFGVFTGGGPDPENRKNNIFYNHGKKHQIAAMPTISMGQRLQAAIGDEEITFILSISRNKELLSFREASIYFDRKKGEIQTPRTVTNRNRSRSILLYAIEVFDDALVGFSNYSMKISERTDAIFSRVAFA
jgi:AbiV family abortive infection protein